MLELAETLDARLADWIANEVAFVSTSADRITPATTDADRALVRKSLGS